MGKSATFLYGQDTLSIGTALDIANNRVIAKLSPAAIAKVKACKKAVDSMVKNNRVVYGVNTGFGPLCTTIISKEEITRLQSNILKSHSVGVGATISPALSRLMMILKTHALAMGYSGIALDTLRRILWHIERDITPVVPAQGSVGASGDLAPLAHLFLPLVGLGEVHYKGKIVATKKMFQKEGLAPLALGPKEGLALINGTQFIAANAVKAMDRLHNCLNTADIISAMTLEAILGSAKPFEPRLHEIRPYRGCTLVAHRIHTLLLHSEILAAHKDCGRVQDPYSIRCIPQVHGATRNAWLHVKELLTTEINSVTDNPIIFNKETAISCGNFHGQPMALPLDYLAFAASELGNISDRRTYLLLEGTAPGLPKLLMKNTGINSGFMIPQYTSAALVSENKTLCFPASADSIPTSLGQEDHVSMGSISARKLNRVIDNLINILAVELVCAAQAFDFRRPLHSSIVLEACHRRIRTSIDHADNDRIFAEDLKTGNTIITNKELMHCAESIAEKEHIDLNGEYHALFDIY